MLLSVSQLLQGWKIAKRCNARTFRHGAQQKNSDTVFDFDTQGIDMYVDEDWVR
jgi:predicted peroxiredoxin